MNDTTTPTRPTPILFLLLFILAAAALGYVSLRHRSDYITLTINNTWRIYLMRENRTDAIQYHAGHFRVTRRDSRRLWLNGEGEIHWRQNVIRVHKAGVYFNHKMISRFYRETQVNIVFEPDGTVRKGKPKTQHPD